MSGALWSLVSALLLLATSEGSPYVSEGARPQPPEAAFPPEGAGPPPVGDAVSPPEEVAAAAAEWAARRRSFSGHSRDDNRLPPSEYVLPPELSRLFNARVTVSSGREVRLSDVESLNFTAIQVELDGLLDEQRTGVNRQGRMFPSFLTSATALLDIKQVWREIETSVMSSVSCTACKAGVGLLQHYVSTGRSKGEIVRAAVKLCRSLQFESPRVCEGIIHLFADEVIFVFQRIALSPDEVCGMVVGDVCATPFNPWHEWTVPLPSIPKPYTPTPEPDPEAPTARVLHISDTHFDPYYKEGTDADCGEPLCCRETSGYPKRKRAAAGFWGDYRRCDTPLRTIENMLQQIADVHGPTLDYIIWTGDLPPHDVWNQTRHENINIIRQSHQLLLKYFPQTPIFPALGNHEAAPVNSFPPPEIGGRHSVSWLYDELDKEWRRWLPEQTSATVRRGAFYSVLVKPGFRIVSLNMNYCNNKNWWLLLNATDPAQELSWLIYELQSAELNDEKVHILGHIPPGHTDCLAVWSKNYYRIVDRYSGTIAAQFFGHTHFDEYSLVYPVAAPNGSEPGPVNASSVMYIAPSITTYVSLNPGYRVYDVERDGNKMVVDHETWVMDLDKANRFGRPHWYRLYSARKAFGMASLAPHEWDRLVHRMALDERLFQKYYRFYMKASPVRPKCDAECKKRLLCDIVSGRSNARQFTCKRLEKQFEKAQSRAGWMARMGDYLGMTPFVIGAIMISVPLLYFTVG
ncbi:sphingomyelin phosphodiesterase-like isoform X2 [Amphibalanus amphitrite]|uniref:sphingomyelin phosphodiesterase-like isoform X2 n=2 Tax=Amphibalanus amphitrite TaxID=1232801 RepID=UPI001C915F7D|nr:sphingomyelin phosphodiesterase-like isoform X2 [Amphibalanus amphitrite]